MEAAKASADKALPRKVMTAWLFDPLLGKTYTGLSESITGTETQTRREEWQSYKEMMIKFTEDEFDRHVDSGRLLVREDPMTAHTWQYMDTAYSDNNTNNPRPTPTSQHLHHT